MEKKFIDNAASTICQAQPKAIWRTGNQIVSYTRVSDPSQFDNTSLESQKKKPKNRPGEKVSLLKIL
ncbi:MAG: hypothetical protein IPI88_07855 [Chitinophagaceae bacterium]|nr:hypothetical protein [Chitinophagaceae bacterium]